ncbi:MAG: hypothetical protein GY738_12230 [Pseudoalteromonas sp.]|nr:hypothetical protein [Pseudoalteromonas sp.]
MTTVKVTEYDFENNNLEVKSSSFIDPDENTKIECTNQNCSLNFKYNFVLDENKDLVVGYYIFCKGKLSNQGIPCNRSFFIKQQDDC